MNKPLPHPVDFIRFLMHSLGRFSWLWLLGTHLATAQPAAAPSPAKPLLRKDSFFGLHFDFHAGANDRGIGRTLTAGMIDSMLAAVQPDFIQVDCKGHPGLSSYPTRVGNPAPGFTQDPLKLWRERTTRRGVALYVHYSGVYDIEALRKHPEWGTVHADGRRDSSYASVYSPYADQLLIPQLKELSQEYGINGAWVDGDCWAMRPDYSEASLAAFRKETGLTTVPRTSADSGYAAFMEFNRRSFRRYVDHYTRAVHAVNPRFQIASNWAFSSFMPEPVDVDVDFLSGDLTPVNSVNSAAFEARCLASQGRQSGKPWDLMSWSFTLNWDRSQIQSLKSAVQLQQEAAEIMAMGGGFQAYFTQNHDASIKPWQVERMTQLARFARARQPFCQGAQPLPQIALLYSSDGSKRLTAKVYSPSNGELDPMQGVLTALLDGQHAVEVVMEHHLKERLPAYPLVVIPEWAYLRPSFRDSLLTYVAGGGNLLVVGADAVRLFEKALNGQWQGLPAMKNQWLGLGHTMAGVNARYQPVVLPKEAQAVGTLYEQQDLRYPKAPAASIHSYGKGKIAALYLNLGGSYLDHQTPLPRELLTTLVNRLFPDPKVEVQGSHLVHVTVNQLNRQLVVNLINTGGPHANKNVYTYEEVPPVGPLRVSIRSAQAPKAITLQPQGQPLKFRFVNGKAEVEVPKLEIHQLLVVEQN